MSGGVGHDFGTQIRAARNGLLQECGRMREGAGSEADLVGKEAFPEFDQRLIQREQKAAPGVITNCEWIRRGRAIDFEDFVPSLLEQGTKRSKCEKPAMTKTKDAFAA